MVDEFTLKPFAALGCLLTRRVDGDFRPGPEPGETLLEAQERQPVSVGMILTVKLSDQGIGSLKVREGRLRVLSAVERSATASVATAPRHRPIDGEMDTLL